MRLPEASATATCENTLGMPMPGRFDVMQCAMLPGGRNDAGQPHRSHASLAVKHQPGS